MKVIRRNAGNAESVAKALFARAATLEVELLIKWADAEIT